MYSNKEMKGVQSQETEGVDNSKELEENKSTALESCTAQFTVSPKTTNGDLKPINKLSNTVATQTSLELLKFTLTQAPSDKHFVDSTTSPMCTNLESADNMKDLHESAKSVLRPLVQNQTSIIVSRETTTQEISLRPSLTCSRILGSQDVLQVSTSFTSSKSGLKNEVLTVTTDYGSPSTDTCSIMIDTINQNGNQAVRLSVQNIYEGSDAMELSLPLPLLPLPLSLPLPLPLPLTNTASTRNSLFTHRMNHRSRNIIGPLNDCLRCVCSVDNEPDTYPYIRDAPPAYSAMYANHRTTIRNWRPFRSGNQPSFVAPIPPPSYAQTEGICLTSYSMDDLFTTSRNRNRNRLWSPRPATAICPRCTTIVVTTIEVRHSISTHMVAFALFLCGCWPCCMIPYCMDSCKNIDHRCPICHAYLGTYRPW